MKRCDTIGDLLPELSWAGPERWLNEGRTDEDGVIVQVPKVFKARGIRSIESVVKEAISVTFWNRSCNYTDCDSLVEGTQDCTEVAWFTLLLSGSVGNIIGDCKLRNIYYPP